MKQWMTETLSRKVLLAVAWGLAVASVGFLVLFVSLYYSELSAERAKASERINRLLQASLENAMIKRDLDGLQRIVSGLGQQEGVAGVMILDPNREVRFASDPDRLGEHLPGEALVAHTRFVERPDGREVLRSVNPVTNKPQCAECHGPVADNPVNGILLVDYDAGALRSGALHTALTLGGSGLAVLLLTLGLLWAVLRHVVVQPVQRLEEASARVSQGDLTARVQATGRDELARLARTFNRMAKSVEASMAEVHRRDEFFQALIDAIPDGVRVIDRDYRIVAANRAYAAQIGGTGPEGEIGRPCYASSHRRDTACPQTLVTCPLAEIRRTGAPVKAVHQHRDGDGKPFYVEVFAAPMTVRDADGRRQTLVVEAIRDMRADMEVSHSQRLSEVGQLATGVAHEIRNPLVAIRMAIEGLLRKSDAGLDADPAELSRYLSVIRDQVESCVGVSERLLNLTQIPAEGEQPVDVAAALDDAVALLGYEAKICGVEVVLDPPPKRTRVTATNAELRMVIVNLMQNAFHAMPKGGTLTLSTTVADDTDTVTIAVKDTGVGISRDTVERIFDPYFSSRADGVEGTGMGLTICKEIVETYGGTITVDSVEGAGTTFRVVLRRAPADV